MEEEKKIVFACGEQSKNVYIWYLFKESTPKNFSPAAGQNQYHLK
jgi:hypothetical protein